MVMCGIQCMPLIIFMVGTIMHFPENVRIKGYNEDNRIAPTTVDLSLRYDFSVDD